MLAHAACWIALAQVLRPAELRERMKECPEPPPWSTLPGAARRSALAILRDLEACGARAIPWPDPEYPPLLRNTGHEPPILYARGPLSPAALPTVAVIGSRRPTRYGLAVAQRLAADLAAAGVVVVSGLAAGIDSAAHQGALRVGGATVAVLGCGIDRVYPPSARDLYAEIARRGLILSEYPPGAPALKGHFPARNRIIAGMSYGVVVVQAGERSGTFSTVGHALAYGREVCAVPGPVDCPLSAGPHRLIQEGAALVTGADGVLAALGLPQAPRREEAPAGPAGEAGAVLAALAGGPAPPEALAMRTGLPLGALLGALTRLEIEGAVARLPDGSFYKVPGGGRA